MAAPSRSTSPRKPTRAICDCGYSTDLVLGGGMDNFETVCLFPVYCRGCRTLQEVNLLASPVTCPGCRGEEVVAYDATEFLGEAGEGEVFFWRVADRLGRDLTLSNGRYFCPGCHQMRLRFVVTGCWD